MRKSDPLLDSLFNEMTGKVLTATILRPEKAWYLSDLANHLGVVPSSLQRPLAKLTGAGILSRHADGNRVYYRPDSQCPIFLELTGILTKTTGISGPIRDALSVFEDKISVAFIHGSMAQGQQRSESDIDLIVVGDVPGAELAFALHPLRERLGRPVNFTRYTTKELRAKVADGHHFLSAVLNRPRLFLVGDENELGAMVGSKKSRGRAGE